MTREHQLQIDPLCRLRWILVSLLLLTEVLQSDAQSYEWGNVAIGGGGFVSAVIADPNAQDVFYARTDVGGAYRWNETTQSWIPLTDWVSETELGLHGIDGMAVDPSVAGRIYLLAGTTYWNDGKSMFMRSDDYGDTWEKFDITSQFKAHGNGMGRGNGERIAVDPNNSNVIFIGSRFDGMWKSTDRGSTWSQVTSYPVTTTANEAGTSIVIFDPSSASGGVSQTIYAGVGRADDNLYVSHDAGASWSLVAGRPTTASIMPQRMALTSDGNTLYVTYANGAGPHAQTWGGVNDYYNRGAVYVYDVTSGNWTDISPENFMLDLDSVETVHYGAYSGISIDPNNENRILATSINSWTGVQYWNVDGTWEDRYGDNIFVSEDGGQTWREMFRFYWIDGGNYPDYDMVSDNGHGWIEGSTCHWNSSAVIDPFNANRAFVTSGNGIFGTDNLLNSYTVNGVEHGKATWKFKSNGVDETVPQDLVSVPGGPLISTILDYTGFSHTNVAKFVPQHNPPAGSTTGLAVAAQNPAKVVRVGVDMHYSTDTAKTWTKTTINGEKGKLALSADGNVLLHSPQGSSVMYRSTDNGSTWSTVSGISTTSSYLQPVADPVNSNKFYTYDPETGAVMRSTDGGASFSQASTVAIDGKRKLRAAPGREGDIWIALDSAGLVRSTDSGSSFSTISGITICRAVGFGKADSAASYPAVYIWGIINGVTGIYQSIDEGATWTRVNDDDHEYGGPANGEYVVGDMNVFGRVYMSTAGRGIVYGEPASTSDYLIASSNSLDFSSFAGSKGVTVSSSVSWTVSDDQDWISTSDTTGSNDGSFSVIVAEDTTTSGRTGTVTISGGGITETISITQGGASENISLSATSLSFTAEDSSEVVYVGANIAWTVSDDQSWISTSDTTGSNDGFFSVLVTANTDSTSRSGTVTVTGGEITRTIDVFQASPFGTTSVWLEAECGNVGSLWNVYSDGNASGAFVTIQSGSNRISSAPGDSEGHISYTFDVSESGNYVLWSRVVAPTASDDSFWIRVDGGSWLEWNNIAPGSTSWTWDDVTSYSLDSGSHTFTVAYREDGARLDRFMFTNTGETPTGEGSAATNCSTGGTDVWVEAECGESGSLWDTASDTNSSNEQYVTVQSGNNSTSNPPGTNGHMNYNFNVNEGGNYKVWARVITPNANDDSFWVRMDSSSWSRWNNIPLTSTWGWDDLHDQGTNTWEVYYNLKPGDHTLTVAYREDGAQLDKVLVTNAGTTPSGEGSAAPSCNDNIVVRALGTNGDETIDLRVDGTTVATWTLDTTFTDYTASGNGEVTVHFTNDNSGRDVQVDYVIINDTTYQSEDQFTNTGVWQNSSCGGSNSEWLHCNGYISYTSAPIVVRALGSNGDETVELRVDSTIVATWTLTTSFADYTATAESGAVTVHFTNDSSGRDVQVDYITIDATTYESEDQTTNTGVWQNSSCGGSNSEWLHCDGYIEYASASSARKAEFENSLAAPDQSGIVIYPNPSEDGRFYIDVPSGDGNTGIHIFNVQGKLVHSQVSTGVNKVEVNSVLNSGIYVVRIHSESINVSRKLVIR